MPRSPLPESYRHAHRIRCGYEIQPSGENRWHRVDKRIDIHNTIKFVFVDGREFFAERNDQLVSRYQPEA
jgi:hypothetical protein